MLIVMGKIYLQFYSENLSLSKPVMYIGCYRDGGGSVEIIYRHRGNIPKVFGAKETTADIYYW